jgi:putative aldouronate transport system substrate-binding protein
MKKFSVIALALFCGAVMSVFAGGSSQGASASQVQVSAPGVLPITQQKTNLDVFMVESNAYPLEGNLVLQNFEAATNVHLNLTIAKEDGATERLNLLLNSGQYPEVIISGFTASDLVRYGTTEKILIPLNKLIDDHGANIKDYFAKYPWVRESMTSPDGNLYGIPSVDSGAKVVGHGSIGYKLWLNTDWLAKLGLSKPTTTEEFRNVLRAFKTRDPNGNGRADEIPLTGAYGTWAADPYLFLLNAFGYYSEDNVMLKNNTFTPVANQDYIRDGLIYIKSLYDEGLLDQASLTQTLDQMTVLGNNEGAVIVGAATAGHVGMMLNVSDSSRGRLYSALEPLRGPSGYRGIPFSGDEVRPTSAAFVITDKCKNPAVAIKWADAFCTEYWTVRGQVGATKGYFWDDADPGTNGMDGKPATYKYLIGASEGIGGKERLGWSLRLLEENWKARFQVVGDIYDGTNYEARLVMETLNLVPYAADVQIIPPLAYSQDAADRLAQIRAPISDHVKTSFAEFISGRRNLDTNGWNTYKQELERLGYSEYVSIMQSAYNAR